MVFRSPYQSELTGPMVDGILSEGYCALPRFGESVDLHEPFIKAVYSVFSDLTGENPRQFVPIT